MTAIKHSLELICNPFFLLFCFIVLGTLLLKVKPRCVLIQYCFIAAILFFIVFSTGWLPRYITGRLEASYPVVHTVNPNIKWVVVLGGGHSEQENWSANSLLSGASIKRLVEGVRLLNELPQAKLLLSGGGKDLHYSEAMLLSQVSQWFSISKKRIVREPNSLNTEEQARALVPLIQHEPFYLVTSAIHMPRSMFLFQQQGLRPIAAPTDFTLFWYDSNEAKLFIPNVYNLYYFTIAMHELLGRAWLNVKGKLV